MMPHSDKMPLFLITLPRVTRVLPDERDLLTSRCAVDADAALRRRCLALRRYAARYVFKRCLCVRRRREMS